MAELAAETRDMDFRLEQVQDFTPTPMTVSTVAWHAGYHPYTLEPVYAAHSADEKQRQRMFFFWYKPEYTQAIRQALQRMGRTDLIGRLCPSGGMRRPPHDTPPQSQGKRRPTGASKDGRQAPNDKKHRATQCRRRG